MQFKKVLVFMAVLFSAVSCIEVDKSLGEDLIPESEELYMGYSEVELPVRVNLSDSLQTLNNTYAIFGSFNTQEYGVSNFAAAGDITLSKEGVNLGKEHVVTSVYLVLPVDEKFALSESDMYMPQELNVYRTYKHIDSVTCYNNSLKEEDYSWYLDLRRYGGCKHAGYGLGFERIIMYLTGIQNIRDVLPFPRTTGSAEF